MRSVVGVEWNGIVAHAGKVTLPLILVAPSFTFFVAPIIGKNVTLLGNYNPGSMFTETTERVAKEKEVRVIVKIPCRYCGTLNDQLNLKCEPCGAPLR